MYPNLNKFHIYQVFSYVFVWFRGLGWFYVMLQFLFGLYWKTDFSQLQNLINDLNVNDSKF